ncbi:MAG: purine-nucleoside phosphorylase [Stygiobacter sp. RIFOXYC12_FULL_38_8]|nr:MAG: purine-nucleoside phosphorylase [Stygiobacter sp. GWC2_38_9]OGU85794.1 MAG: purine-nucleoside phosphorylase [Stygiobacter sp. RIFOXYA12_FULL_38_9]OGV09258.1 MAG: purine-nucleoside phosphorylase [Stygiobacter sp. RIFOXYB2_FULL_37_11]OGV09866.1 MAG: purine-nucleoside phosphorylase [Stygiobacter sp. RIFOXYA2_FULL_38_8]OGV16204.1 MAG: purine-nucleoside phosphorylase [Stygiobacter sp. RIFOXYC2_FULL_38_25]OGV22458.1 MAG: purine-nucleoside phosphorylase [Stygiobacter sp. RIFOXYC12_FULL_38_8]
MSSLLSMINETLEVIRKKTTNEYEVGIVLGTGLGGLVREIEVEHEIEYGDLPHFPLSTVESHQGKLIFGKINGKNVVAMQGRFHYYEGYTMRQITYPIRVMKFLGVKTLLVSNACGGMNPIYRRGDVMIMLDHINLLGDNPLIGKNEDELGPRFPDMSEPYNLELIKLAEEVALENKIKVQKGVYVAVPGPNLETKAEYRFLRNIGADVVGMSTIPENIVANHMGMKVLGFSIITDECFPETLRAVDVQEIIATAMGAEPKMTLIMKEVIKKL